MKVSVRVRGEWLAVPCPDPKRSVSWLGQEALKRYTKLQPPTYTGKEEKVGFLINVIAEHARIRIRIVNARGHNCGMSILLGFLDG